MSNKIGTTFLTVVLSMALGGAVVGGVTWAVRDDAGSPSPSAVTAPTGSSQDVSANGAAGADTNLTALYERVRPSVVRITTGQTGDPFDRSAEGLGSGIVLDTDGRILTNYHVVRGSEEVTVTFSDGTVAQATVIGKDPGNDVALIQTDADASVLKPATLGSTDSIKVGSFVAAIGNPFGLDGSFTTGVISGTDRTLTSSANGRPIRGLLQTDTAINPGNSGGALFNARGEVIGINTAIENPNGDGFVGVGYAVPIDTPKRFLSQLTAGDTIDHPRLGISGRSLTEEDARQLGVPQGVAVLSVDPGSAADNAGLNDAADGTGDVITAIDGAPMTTFEDLADFIDSKDVGDQVTLSVHRDGEDIELKADLKSWDSTA